MAEELSLWLALREPADAVSRSASLTAAIARAIAPATPLDILDLATGAGSNLRYLVERLPGDQRWLVADRSATLLSHLSARTMAWARGRGYDVEGDERSWSMTGDGSRCHVETRELNLSTLDAALFTGRHLVTASALLDLVSVSWLQSLARHCRTAGAAALFTITYNGVSRPSPPEPEDERVLELFNRHQRTDKGLGGVATGPDAARAAVHAFEEAGYNVRAEESDWRLEPGDAELQRQLIEGWGFAATDISPGDAATIEGWKRRRLQHVDAGRSLIVVGHTDVAAIL
jgi:hypothetical protein